MRLSSALKGWVAILICIAFLALLVGTSESFQKCEHERKNHEAYKALHEQGGLLVKPVLRLRLHMACARVTAGENDGAITALSGIAVAVFTLLLWISTHRLWRTGEQQATLISQQSEIVAAQRDIAYQTFVVSNRPILIVRGMRAYEFDVQLGQFTVIWTTVNAGTADAIIVSGIISCAIRDPRNVVRDVYSRGDIIGAEDVTSVVRLVPGNETSMNFTFAPIVSERFRLCRESMETTIRGHLTYLSPSGRTHEIGFEWRYDINRLGVARFIRTDDPEQNYSY